MSTLKQIMLTDELVDLIPDSKNDSEHKELADANQEQDTEYKWNGKQLCLTVGCNYCGSERFFSEGN